MGSERHALGPLGVETDVAYSLLSYLHELSARIDALLEGRPEPPWRVAHAGIELDRLGHRAWYRGRPLSLTPTEYRLLECLLLHTEAVVPREALRKAIWGADAALASNVVDVHVSHLRRKLEAAGSPRILLTERGKGFVLREPEPLPADG